MIAGAYKAEQLAGKAGKIANVGNGCTFEAKKLILQGRELACSVYLPRTEGRIAVQALVKAVNGSKKTGIYVNANQFSPIGSLGTKANIARFTPQFHS
jgi:ABC-type sugar transport system substrate-binding protein